MKKRDLEKRQKTRALLYRWGSTNERLMARSHELEEKQSVIDTIVGIGAQNYDGMPHATSISDPTGNAAMQLEQAKESLLNFCGVLKREIDQELRFQSAINGILQELDWLSQTIIKMRYEQKMPFFKMAQKTNYSEIWLKQQEAAAIDKISDRVIAEGNHEETREA